MFGDGTLARAPNACSTASMIFKDGLTGKKGGRKDESGT